MDILERFSIYVCGLDGDGRIISGETGLWHRLGVEVPSFPVAGADLLDELVGLEGRILDIARSGAGGLSIPGIRREACFLDLFVLPVGELGSVPGIGDRAKAVLVVRDCSEAMRAQQSLMQQRNEIDLLRRDIERRNAKLAELMEIVRGHNHDLATEVRARTEEIRASRLSVISRLARVAEYRDTETGGHIYRIGRSCVLVGRALGMDDEDCEDLFHASLLHDVGKVGIPDSILLKPGPLDPGEVAAMRSHTVIGSDILSGDDSRLFRKAREVARFHHERWDGRGYPEALRGEAIPLSARICAIVDVFDALLSARPYKEPWPLEKALGLVRAETGASFEPRIVEAFLGMSDDIVKLRESSLESSAIEDLQDIL
jgi:response regulator RpfG family c-di-GMP phosphodiesterase